MGYVGKEIWSNAFSASPSKFRGIPTRYDKNPLNFLAAVKIGAARIWIKALSGRVGARND